MANTSPASLFQRWGQPGQQQGRRIPSLSSVRTRSMCCLRVSGFLTEITQHIHSLRASGVISSHFASAAESEMRTVRKSAGTSCTAPGEIVFLVMDFILRRLQSAWGVLGCCPNWALETELIWTGMGWRNIAISNNVGGVKYFLSALRHALGEERHLALVDGLRFPTGLASNRWGQELSPTHPSLRSQLRS
jgi:hypothetical protein